MFLLFYVIFLIFSDKKRNMLREKKTFYIHSKGINKNIYKNKYDFIFFNIYSSFQLIKFFSNQN